MPNDAGVRRSRESVFRLRDWLAGQEARRGVVLTRPGSVAWVTGGLGPPVDRTAGVDLVWAVVRQSGCTLVTTEVEHGRVRDEYDPAEHGFDLVAVPWYEADAFVRAAEEAAEASASDLLADGHPAFGRDVSDDLVSLRLSLSHPEREEMRALGADAARALEDALAVWKPGERDLDVQARMAASLEAVGADAPVLIVGGDERVRRYRHPMAVGARAETYVMAVVVARRAGLHVAATRFVSAGPLPPDLVDLRARVLRVEAVVLSSSRPGSTYGGALAALDRAYADVGAPDGWAGHYQGGPIGYAQREFEIAPCQRASRWWEEPIASGHAIAWNPSLPGGVKAEDTYLVTPAGLERITDGEGWPAEPGDGFVPPRPAVLEIGG